ncbi:hypothetical protein V8E54_001851 [Elaphomyces granulatus]
MNALSRTNGQLYDLLNEHLYARDLRSRVMEGGHSALMLAATSKSEMVINLLLDRGGIDVNRQDDLGRTALGEAALEKTPA